MEESTRRIKMNNGFFNYYPEGETILPIGRISFQADTGLDDEELELISQMTKLSYYIYYTDTIKFMVEPGWVLIENYNDTVTSLDVQIYRAPMHNIGKFAYTFVFKGSQEFQDYIVNLGQVIFNNGDSQIQKAEPYVQQKINQYAHNMGALYFTGHSLGGYITQWIQSEIVDKVIIAPVPSKAYTFNAPGFSKLSINSQSNLQNYYSRLVIKLNDPTKYTSINNYRIISDPISAFGTRLGNKYSYTVYYKGKNPFYYHSLLRFFEVYSLCLKPIY